MTQLMTLGAFMTVRYDPPQPQPQEVITFWRRADCRFRFSENQIYFRKPSSFNVFDVMKKAINYLFYVPVLVYQFI